MLTANHDEFIVEQLREDSDFFRVYCEESLKETDPFLFQEALQYIIKAKGFNFDVVAREKDVA